jgi:hypothetical protein
MDALMLRMRETHHDPMNTSMFDAEAYHRQQPVSPGTCCKQFQFQLCDLAPTVHTEVIHQIMLLFFDSIRRNISGGIPPTNSAVGNRRVGKTRKMDS